MKTMTMMLWMNLGILLSGCQSGPKPIQYGSDMCHYCKMSIVDDRHGAELVTAKGRAYLFDAVECLVNFSLDESPAPGASWYVNFYETPGELIDATQAHYLVSREIPSPMGGYLTAFRDKTVLEKVLQDKDGQALSWEELSAYVKTIRF